MSAKPTDDTQPSATSTAYSSGLSPPSHDPDVEESGENTPLLSRNERNEEEDETEDSTPRKARDTSRASRLLNSIKSQSFGKGGRLTRWPSLLALSLLIVVIALILVGGFFAPQALEEYSSQAARFEPVRLSIKSFTHTGVVARVEGDFSIDSNRVKKKSVRDFGRFATWIAYEAETGDAHLQASLPEQDDLVLGTAKVPPIKVNVRDGHTTRVDFLTEMDPGISGGLRRIANDWIEGRLGRLRIQANADLPIKSGIINLGRQTISQSLTFESKSG